MRQILADVAFHLSDFQRLSPHAEAGQAATIKAECLPRIKAIIRDLDRFTH